MRHSPACVHAPRSVTMSLGARGSTRVPLSSRNFPRCCAAPANHGALAAVELRKSLARSHASRAPRSSCRSRRCPRWRTGAARGPSRSGLNHRRERKESRFLRRSSTLANSTLHPPNAGSGEFHRPFRGGGRPLCLRHSPAAAAPRALLRSLRRSRVNAVR